MDRLKALFQLCRSCKTHGQYLRICLRIMSSDLWVRRMSVFKKKNTLYSILRLQEAIQKLSDCANNSTFVIGGKAPLILKHRSREEWVIKFTHLVPIQFEALWVPEPFRRNRKSRNPTERQVMFPRLYIAWSGRYIDWAIPALVSK